MECFQQDSRHTTGPPLLYLPGFTAYLTSTANSVFAPERAERYQDMTRPLTDYYICSSHNTYLVRLMLFECLAILTSHLYSANVLYDWIVDFVSAFKLVKV